MYQISKLPVYALKSQPQGPKGAKGLERMTVSHYLCLEKYLNQEIAHIRRCGYKRVQSMQMTTMLPINCPICHQKGNATFGYDRRSRNKKWIEREAPIVIHYYHGYGKPRHYYGTWKNGHVQLSPSIKDIRDATAFGQLAAFGQLNKKSRAKLT